MLEIKSKVKDRKELVNRINELTGSKLKYQGVPSCAYQGSGFTVTRSGDLEVDETQANKEVLEKLSQEGLIVLPKDMPDFEAEQETEPESKPVEYEPYRVQISVPLEHHTGASLRNLMNLIFQRQVQINKATHGCFRVNYSLIETLAREGKSDTVVQFLHTVKNASREFEGIEFSYDKITFTGFPSTDDPEMLRIYLQLASQMNRQALTQKRINPKMVEATNEKYAFRIWLLRIGMNGPEYKTARKILLSNLSGDCAFRTEKQKKQFLEKMSRKRKEAKDHEISE